MIYSDTVKIGHLEYALQFEDRIDDDTDENVN